jgi:Ca2+/H+ antiporter
MGVYSVEQSEEESSNPDIEERLDPISALILYAASMLMFVVSSTYMIHAVKGICGASQGAESLMGFLAIPVICDGGSILTGTIVAIRNKMNLVSPRRETLLEIALTMYQAAINMIDNCLRLNTFEIPILILLSLFTKQSHGLVFSPCKFLLIIIL